MFTAAASRYDSTVPLRFFWKCNLQHETRYNTTAEGESSVRMNQAGPSARTHSSRSVFGFDHYIQYVTFNRLKKNVTVRTEKYNTQIKSTFEIYVGIKHYPKKYIVSETYVNIFTN